MFSNTLRCAILVIVLLGAVRATPVSLSSPANSEPTRILEAKFDEMRKYMNVTIDPCEDFYEFTCGNYGQFKTSPSANTAFDYGSFFEKVNTLMRDKIKKALNTTYKADTNVDKQVKKFYRSCRKVATMENVYHNQVQQVLEEFAQRPFCQEQHWQGDDFDVLQTTARIIYKTGLKILFELDIMADFHNKTIHRLRLAQAFQNRDVYVNELLASSRELLANATAKNLHSILGIDAELADEIAKEIIDFKVALARGMVDEKLGLKNDEIYTLVTVDEIQTLFLPMGDFKQFLSQAMGYVPEELYVHMAYVKNALDVLTQTPKRVVANYIFYTYVANFIVDESDLDSFCIEITQNFFYRQLDNMIYRRFYSSDLKEGLLFMWQELKAAFAQILQSPRLSWMQENTRSYALDKLKHLKLSINTYEDYDSTAEFMQLSINESNYVNNIAAILEQQGKRKRGKINETPQPEEIGDIGSYTALNFFELNEVQVPVHFLEPHYMWSNYYPQAYNFATLGSIMGHEIIHSFDNIGQFYDKHGHLGDWWDAQSSQVFRQRTKCFVNQYKAYNYGGRPLPEMASQGENIADNSGVRMAYEAYRIWHQKSKGRQDDVHFASMPGFNYTDKQLFFISYGQVWCADIPADDMAKVAVVDIHVPDKLRVIGSLSNLEEFSKEFNCPRGSSMNPVKKCEIF